jgi:NAD(P)H-hydrate epimerase
MTREQMRAYDAFAIDHCNVPGLVLMENAGRAATDVILRRPEAATGSLVVVCGGGNNGGDGLVVARHLAARGRAVEVFVVAERDVLRGDAATNLAAYEGLGGKVCFVADDLGTLSAALERSGLCVDALFGTGLSRPLEGRMAAVVTLINERAPAVAALDIPSGLDANTGAELGVAVRAVCTITFGHYKLGLFQGAAWSHAGAVERVGLGIFDGAVVAKVGHAAGLIDDDLVRRVVGGRQRHDHKYRAGSVLVVAGSAGKVGAALLCARAVLRAGGGIATVASWKNAVRRMDGRVHEVMTHALDPRSLDESLAAALQKRQAVAIGPGLGLGAEARAVTEKVVLGFDGPVVVDADAISHFAGRPEALRAAPAPRVLTPHSGELGRLLGTNTAEVEDNRVEAARLAAQRARATLVLKGPGTVVASPDGRVAINATGNAVLATAGAGDVLTGIAAALCCRAEVFDAVCAAVYLHGLCGDAWRERHASDRGLLAGELSDLLPSVLGTYAARA